MRESIVSVLLLLAFPAAAPAQADESTAEEITKLLLSSDEADHTRGVVLAAGADEAVLREVLETLRERALAARPAGPAVRCDATLVRLDAAQLEELGVAPEASGNRKAETLFLAAEQVKELTAAGKADEPAVVLTGSRLALHQGESATVQATEQVAYISDYDVTVNGKEFMADPVVETLKCGVLADITCEEVDEEGGALIQVELTQADLTRPIQTITTSLGSGGSKVTIQLPEFTVSTTSTVARVATGGSAMLVFSRVKDDLPWFGVLIEVSKPEGR